MKADVWSDKVRVTKEGFGEGSARQRFCGTGPVGVSTRNTTVKNGDNASAGGEEKKSLDAMENQQKVTPGENKKIMSQKPMTSRTIAGGPVTQDMTTDEIAAIGAVFALKMRDVNSKLRVKKEEKKPDKATRENHLERPSANGRFRETPKAGRGHKAERETRYL